ncbi:atp-dependent transporter [Malassezia pachydermatis]|uniref:Atp-dependent transporter n=1 Tax=Malassezia pachydermatis TaxID=77020 RepID=A0A0M8MTY3_9BASI|nr:atp-dependent transporter [Malassezia pachydermatis]KOS14284.1 atp-dependent transporter [Malassezia pachydermatis]
MASPLAVQVHDLHYRFTTSSTSALEGCDLLLPRGARCLLIGANGAGKSTLLRLLAGKRLCEAHIRVFGQDVFRAPPQGITYLGTEWAMNPVVRSDITVQDFLNSVGGFRFSERRDRLLDLLDVDLSWRMHMISDGERRRVQLCMGLMEPWQLLLLDEVTVDLDVQVRCDLLDFLKEESETRGATIVYATHIFDGIHSFPTNIVHVQLGRTTTAQPFPWPLPPPSSLPEDLASHLPATLQKSWSQGGFSSISLLDLALAWLREDRVLREQSERQRGIKRGRANRSMEETTDAKKFFSQYDYYTNFST